MAKSYIFRTGLRWDGSKRGQVSSPGKPRIGVSTPPEFRGEEGFWSPEELLLSAVDSCIMTTFIAYAGIKKAGFVSYESETEGVLERVDGRFMFSRITVKPRVVIKGDEQDNKIREIMSLAEANCFISSSIRSEVRVLPEIIREE